MTKDDGVALLVLFGIAWWVSRRAEVTTRISYPGIDDNPSQNPQPVFETFPPAPDMNIDDPSTWGIDFGGGSIDPFLEQEQSE